MDEIGTCQCGERLCTVKATFGPAEGTIYIESSQGVDAFIDLGREGATRLYRLLDDWLYPHYIPELQGTAPLTEEDWTHLLLYVDGCQRHQDNQA